MIDVDVIPGDEGHDGGIVDEHVDSACLCDQRVEHSGFEMSQATPTAPWPMAFAAASAPAPLMSLTKTLAPSAARRDAMALPMPCAAPVTIAVLPFSASAHVLCLPYRVGSSDLMRMTSLAAAMPLPMSVL